MELERFIRDFEAQLEDVEPNPLDPGTEFKKLEAWDSMNMLVVIAMVDRKYDVQIGGEAINEANTLEDLYNKIKAMKEN